MANIIIIGAAGFIGTNLTLELAKDISNQLTLVDVDFDYFEPIRKANLKNVVYKKSTYGLSEDYASLVKGQDIVYHLVSTTTPTTSNQRIPDEIEANVVFSAKLLQGCVDSKVKKVVFVSSGGTVYGKEVKCPIREEDQTNPINSYGFQKLSIEKLLYLFNQIYKLDYRIIRLANPYGPYQRPNGKLGAVTTFTYKALKNQMIDLYGDGSVVRDYVFITDAIRAMINIVNMEYGYKIYNVGSGFGTSLNVLLQTIERVLKKKIEIKHLKKRNVDVPVNYLDISRYESVFHESIAKTSLERGIAITADFLKRL